MRGGGKTDALLTKLRREWGEYTDQRSYVRPDGAEFLWGKDKERRYREVWLRDKRRCVVCAVYLPFSEMEPDHIIKRSAGGDDSLHNLRTYCHVHHRGPKGRHP